MRRKDERAFTLLELLLVILIIGILAAVVVQRFGGVGRRARIGGATAQISSFEGALERYNQDMDAYPTTEEGLIALVRRPDDEELAEKWQGGPYLGKNVIPEDPWGNEYIYKSPGDVNEEGFDIICLGPDGEEGTEDDITSYVEDQG